MTYAIERLQNFLPWNPQGLAAVGPDLAWNTAASFTTNTNWQSYVPETTMSYLTQMVGLAYHNFGSAAVGIVVAVALIRGIKRTVSGSIGNFWVDMTRTFLYVLVPASLVYALLLIAQGVPQNLRAYTAAHPSNSPRKPRPLHRAPSPRRRPSRCWAPTAADSPTPTAPTPSRTPLLSPICCRCSPSSSSPPALPTRWAA